MTQYSFLINNVHSFLATLWNFLELFSVYEYMQQCGKKRKKKNTKTKTKT